MKEGGTQAPIRHPLLWEDPSFYNEKDLDAELRRVFDICHGCRRCFNLCDSFPRLFDLVDESPSGELDTVESGDFKAVVDACTLCDLCFMTKCPYVPPHDFNLDFPHLMVRYRANDYKKGNVSFMAKQLTQMDRNGTLASTLPGLANWASDAKNTLTRPLLEKTVGIDKRANLPSFHKETLLARAKTLLELNASAPAFGRKAVVYATCFGNYNNPDMGQTALKVLAKNGVETLVQYPGCCGMPQFEQGNLASVALKARTVTEALLPWVEKGYDIIALVPSCALMLKLEWPLLLPHDPAIKKLSDATFDLSEYIVDIAKKEGIAPGLKPLPQSIMLHLACHARAQNMGPKAKEMLALIPETSVAVVERCSGHGGSWGIMKDNFDVALKVGKPVAKQAEHADVIASECPLAAEHITQGVEIATGKTISNLNPIELLALSYGF